MHYLTFPIYLWLGPLTSAPQQSSVIISWHILGFLKLIYGAKTFYHLTNQSPLVSSLSLGAQLLKILPVNEVMCYVYLFVTGLLLLPYCSSNFSLFLPMAKFPLFQGLHGILLYVYMYTYM